MLLLWAQLSLNNAPSYYVLPNNTSSFYQIPMTGQQLHRFWHDVIMNILDFDATLVRPRWQIEPPNQPPLTTDWISFGIIKNTYDTYSYKEYNADGYCVNKYHNFVILISFYGPDCAKNELLLRQGLDIPQNREVISLFNQAFIELEDAINTSELVNGRWVQRLDVKMHIRRNMTIFYPVNDIESANIETIVETNVPTDTSAITDNIIVTQN
jgi:hypothetical protein